MTISNYYIAPLILTSFFFSINIHAQNIFIKPNVTDGEYIKIDPSDSDEPVVLTKIDPEITNLEKQIKDREDVIQSTEQEINEINLELNQIYKKKDSLQEQFDALTLTNKRNEVQINATAEGIQKGELTLESLDSTINNNEEDLRVIYDVLTKNYQRVNEFELENNEISVFFNQSFFEIIEYMEEIESYSSSLQEHLERLTETTKELEKNKDKIAFERADLKRKKSELEDRRQLYKFSIAEKERLVNKTKNDEISYQALLKERQEKRLELQREIYEYESRLSYLKDPTSFPEARKGLLAKPFNAPIRITQIFGQTEFARANAFKYGRPFHDGVDYGIPSGTEILAVADALVVGTGNTDLVSSCQSWGKWILLEHPFGLSTLYAHLSLTKVRLGQKLKTGDLIGYSGNTGFSTGPHLHLGVYDSNGVKVIPYEQVSSSARCRGLLVPVAAQEAKLNPLDYLAE